MGSKGGPRTKNIGSKGGPKIKLWAPKGGLKGCPKIKIWGPKGGPKGGPGIENMSLFFWSGSKKTLLDYLIFSLSSFWSQKCQKSGRIKKNTQPFRRPQLASHQASQGRFCPKSGQNALFPCLFHYILHPRPAGLRQVVLRFWEQIKWVLINIISLRTLS